jgi:hypothetical protein
MSAPVVIGLKTRYIGTAISGLHGRDVTICAVYVAPVGLDTEPYYVDDNERLEMLGGIGLEDEIVITVTKRGIAREVVLASDLECFALTGSDQ